MARQDKKKLKVLPAARVAKKAKNMLVQGAAAMSGKSVKSIAASLVGGAIGEAAMDKRKMRRKAQRQQFVKSLQKTKKEFKVEVGEPSKGVGIKDKEAKITVGRPVQVKQPLNKKSTNKMKKESALKMKGPGKKSPAKAMGGGKYIEGFKKMTTKKLFDVVKRNDRGLESGRKEIVKRTKERGDANAIYQAMTANDSTNTAKRVIRHRIKKGTFDDGSLKPGENPFKMKGFSGFKK